MIQKPKIGDVVLIANGCGYNRSNMPSKPILVKCVDYHQFREDHFRGVAVNRKLPQDIWWYKTSEIIVQEPERKVKGAKLIGSYDVQFLEE